MPATLKLTTSAILAIALGCTPPSARAQVPTAATRPAPRIILKLDDLTWDSPAWERTIGFLQEHQIKSGIGIICKSLEGNRNPYYSWLKGIQATGLVEFWNHGLTHKEWIEGGVTMQEFKGPAYEQQKAGFARAQQLAKEKLGITMHTFGPGYGGMDDSTFRVLNEDPDMKVLLYGTPAQAAKVPGILNLERTAMNIENPLFVPNAQRVEQDYQRLVGKGDCFVLQGHPNQWNEARFAEFEKLVLYLQAQGVTFTTPYEYYLSKQTAATLPTPPK